MNLDELTKMYDFNGRTVVVTGGTGVLGQAMVRAIVGCGANVALVARKREKAGPQTGPLGGPGWAGRAERACGGRRWCARLWGAARAWRSWRATARRRSRRLPHWRGRVAP